MKLDLTQFEKCLLKEKPSFSKTNTNNIDRQKLDFIAIDFETANEKRLSACCLALIFFKDGKIVNEKEWFIKPPKEYFYFKEINVQIHGITEEKVKNCPEFKYIYNEVFALINKHIIVAHNSSFDLNVLMQLLDYYELPYPTIDFICTYQLARITWDKQINYTLKSLANNFGYIFNHHDAHDDAKICGKLLLKALEKHNIKNFSELEEKTSMKFGFLDNYNGYSPCTTIKPFKKLESSKKYDINNIVPTVSNFDCTNIFFEKEIVFTGTLLSMTRQTAMQKVVNLGSKVTNSVTKRTNFLVMGIQDYSLFANGKESSKTKKAKELINKGQDLQIINEDTFLRFL